MMLSTCLVALSAMLVSTAYGVVVETRSTTCYRADPDTRSIHTGQLSVDGGSLSLLGFDNHHNVVSSKYATLAKNFTITFEFCPDLGTINLTPKPKGDAYDYQHLGRVVINPSSVIGANTCLTVTNPQDATTATKPNLLLKAEACTSNTKPSASQTFTHGFFSGDGDYLLWTGSKTTPCGRTYGFGWKTSGTPYFNIITNGQGFAELECLNNPKALTLQIYNVNNY